MKPEVRLWETFFVASHADAWIEICLVVIDECGNYCRIPRGCVDWNPSIVMTCPNSIKSHPTRMRGLKSVENVTVQPKAQVASHADAWIEIKIAFLESTLNPSHPTRMRGLKFVQESMFPLLKASHPTRMRGLKFLFAMCYFIILIVASHADAWIEIRSPLSIISW